MGFATIALLGALAAAPGEARAAARADRVVVGMLDPAPAAGMSVLLEETAAWLRSHTVLSMVAGDQVGFDRGALSGCPADKLYACLGRALLAIPAQPRAGILVARARPRDVQLLVLDAAALEPLLAAEDQVYAAVHRIAAPTIGEALEQLAALPGFEPVAEARIEARGCPGCVVRIGSQEAVLAGDPGTVDGLRLRAGRAPVEVLRDGQILLAGRAELRIEQRVEVRVDVPPPRPTWPRVLASGLLIGGSALVASGVAIAAGRDDLICVAPESPCTANLGRSPDPRADDYASAGTTAGVLVVSGAVAALAGLAWWGVELLHDDTPVMTIE